MGELTAGSSRRALIFTRPAAERFGLEGVAGREVEDPAAALFALRAVADRVRATAAEGAAEPVGESAGRLLALGLVGRFLRGMLDEYRRQRDPEVLPKALEWLSRRHGEDRLRRLLERFQGLFLTSADVPGDGRDASERASAAAPEILLEDLLLLWTVNENPAAVPWRPLFDDRELEAETGYREILGDLREFFAEGPGFGPDGSNLFDLLRAPARAAPGSLGDQLRFLLRLGEPAAEGLKEDLLLGIDVLQEEEKPIFPGPGGGPPGPGPSKVLVYDDEGAEERFSEDREWMPRLVLLAKNVFVWLDQISELYGRPIRRLDEIPGRELDRIAGDGVTGLWLIGIWERSGASERIKKLCGNPEAAASAYAIDDYRVAGELGGPEALNVLRRRARRRHLRLACDMVPNHMGIDSRWVLERPELFLSVARCPYPNYTFDGPDLSPDPGVGIFLEDHYFDRSDAAVVFKRLDRRTGEARYLYHGNDGTGMPWNDTAQLDYLNPATRAAVEETILSVAGEFPVIRFDAAMTLARRHVQRLWYPLPGEGGDIPSRSAFALSQEEFDRRLPEEFWREVVDRVGEEAPETLLLAEAFWLMESYFVRTLGMHRVYNSAFMNMLRDEENSKFRDSLKNTLAFQPEILRRFVNYLTNPDEETAARQLGKGEKYFGICTLAVTLPGLPLIGHGQFEGFEEKYGMEYRRAYAREAPDRRLLARHRQEIVPLLERRDLFSGVTRFELYDFETSAGVDENVLAFSNGRRGEGALVVFNNRGETTRGRLRTAVPRLRPPDPAEGKAAEAAGEEAPRTVRVPLSRALGLTGRRHAYVRFRERRRGLEFLVSGRELLERGLPLTLEPYQHRVFTDFEEIRETVDLRLEGLTRALGGEGVPSLQEALEEHFARGEAPPEAPLPPAARLRPLLRPLLAEGGGGSEELEALLAAWPGPRPETLKGSLKRALGFLHDPEAAEEELLGKILADDAAPAAQPAALLLWVLLRAHGEGAPAHFDARRLGPRVEILLGELGVPEAAQVPSAAALRLFLGIAGEARRPPATPARRLDGWLEDSQVRRFFGVHDFDGVRWFSREAFRSFLWWLLATAAVDLPPEREPEGDGPRQRCRRLVRELLAAEAASGYRVAGLRAAVSDVE